MSWINRNILFALLTMHQCTLEALILFIKTTIFQQPNDIEITELLSTDNIVFYLLLYFMWEGSGVV